MHRISASNEAKTKQLNRHSIAYRSLVVCNRELEVNSGGLS